MNLVSWANPLMPYPAGERERGGGREKRCGCYCCASVTDLRCYLAPYEVYAAVFTGVIDEDGLQGTPTKLTVTISESYGTNEGAAQSRLQQIPLNADVTCYYDPKSVTTAVLSLQQTTWKWGVTAVFLFLSMLFLTWFLDMVWDSVAAKIISATFIWMVLVPLVLIAPAISARLLLPGQRDALIIVVSVLSGLWGLGILSLGLAYLRESTGYTGCPSPACCCSGSDDTAGNGGAGCCPCDCGFLSLLCRCHPCRRGPPVIIYQQGGNGAIEPPGLSYPVHPPTQPDPANVDIEMISPYDRYRQQQEQQQQEQQQQEQQQRERQQQMPPTYSEAALPTFYDISSEYK